MDTRSRLAFVATIVAVVVLVGSLAATHKLAPSSFKAFYCAGQSVVERADPYEIEPLRACEHRVAPNALPTYAVEPAPLPGYALAPWALVALLSPTAARLLYYALLIAALALTSFAVAKLAPIQPAHAMLALLSVWFLNLSFSEIPPITTACVALTALMLARNRPWLTAVFAAGVAFEPHLAVPLWIALLLFARTTRVPLVVVGIGLAIVDVAIGGPHQALEYFAQTLPAQALSEVFANDQFSLTHFAIGLGASVPAALRIGLLSYIFMIAAGIVVARRLAGQNAPEYLALVPPAFVLIGGTYLHDVQFYTALPLALVLLARSVRPSVLIACATLLLAVAWSEATSRLILALSATSVFAVAWAALPNRPLRAISCVAAALAAVTLVVALNRLPTAPGVTPSLPPVGAAFHPTDQTGLDWSTYLASDPALTKPSPRSSLRKVPTWAGAMLLVLFSIACVFRRRPSGVRAPPEIADMSAIAGP